MSVRRPNNIAFTKVLMHSMSFISEYYDESSLAQWHLLFLVVNAISLQVGPVTN